MRQKNKGDQTRSFIVDRAMILFARNGFKNTSLSDILAATGLTKGGFYFHFKSKEELCEAVIDMLDEYWRDVLLPGMEAGRNAIEKIEILLSSPGDCLNTPDCIRPTILLLILATEMIEVHDALSQRLQAIFKEWCRKLEEIIDQGKAAGLFKNELCTRSIAGVILSNIMGANLLALLNKAPDIYTNQLNSLKQILFSGISKP